MDLLQTVRKEGSRGGRSEFSWSDVANSAHRQNYLGHSLHAPVGRWQRGRDLSWYAKGDKTEGEEEISEEQRRREELRKVKEAEEDEMRKALGMPPIDRSANMIPLGEAAKLIGLAQEDDEKEKPRDAGRSKDDRRSKHRVSERRRSRSRDSRREHRGTRDRHRDEDRGTDRRRRSDRDDRHLDRRRDDRDQDVEKRRADDRDGRRRHDRSPRRRSYSRSRSRSRTRHRHRSRSPDRDRRQRRRS